MQVSQFIAVFADLFRELERLPRCAVRHENDEIILGKSCCHGILGQDPFQQLCESYDDFIAGLVAECIVNQLQVIEIEIDDLVSIV